MVAAAAAKANDPDADDSILGAATQRESRGGEEAGGSGRVPRRTSRRRTCLLAGCMGVVG